MKKSLLMSQLLPQVRGTRRVQVGQRLRLQALLGGRLDHLDAVLVGAGEEEGVVAPESVVAGKDVADDRRVNVPEVRLAVGVVDRRGDVKAVGHEASLQDAALTRGPANSIVHAGRSPPLSVNERTIVQSDRCRSRQPVQRQARGGVQVKSTSFASGDGSSTALLLADGADQAKGQKHHGPGESQQVRTRLPIFSAGVRY